jgi:drug/metabolite transporter (DMT)-like permease
MTEERIGELFKIAEATLWALFPVVTLLGLKGLPPITFAGISTLFAALFFIAWVTWRGEWHYMHNTVWKEIALSTLFVGVLFYGIYFMGISYTTAGNIAVLALSQIFFAFLFLNILLGLEKSTLQKYVGALLMACGALIVLVPKGGVGFDGGALLVVLAMAFAPIGNWFAKRATQEVSPQFLMMVRSIVSGLFLLSIGVVFEHPSATGVTQGVLLAVVFNGVMLLGLSKVLWLEAIKRIPISKATSIGAIEPFLTLLYAYILLAEVPTTIQLASLVPLLIGLYLITRPHKEYVSQ